MSVGNIYKENQMGKTYANRKKESERPENDFYETPYACTEILIDEMLSYLDRSTVVLDPCCGNRRIGDVLRRHGFRNIIERDITGGHDFLDVAVRKKFYDIIIMNPPFSLFDEFVSQAKYISNTTIVIGKLDYFCCHNRNINGLWKKLKYGCPFDRKIAYDRPFREDGKFECGMLNTGWFVFDNTYNGEPMIHILDVQKYVLKKSTKKAESA